MSTANYSNSIQTSAGKMRNEQEKKVSRSRMITMTAMLSAIATVLMALSIPVPLMPPFIKLDFSELPALIAAYTLGPISGVTVCLVKNLVNVLMTQTAGVGELCNFLLGVAFVLPAGLIYKKKKTFVGAMIGAVIGCISMALFSVPINYYLVYPAYVKIMGYPLDAIIGEYQKINQGVGNLMQALVIFNLPFTFIKGLLNVIITFLIYKPLTPIIKGFHR